MLKKRGNETRNKKIKSTKWHVNNVINSLRANLNEVIVPLGLMITLYNRLSIILDRRPNDDSSDCWDETLTLKDVLSGNIWELSI